MGLNSIATSDVSINQMVKENTLPWGSDNDQYQIWDNWKVNLRDLYVFKPNRELYAWINLTDFNPEPKAADSTNYKELKKNIDKCNYRLKTLLRPERWCFRNKTPLAQIASSRGLFCLW